ncbi:MAG: ribonuclease H-like domain-containing protein [Bacteroidota bacterium]
MLDHISPDNLLFLDIETVSSYPTYEQLSENMKKLWDKKARYLAEDGQSPAEVYNKAGIFAEFGKIICISAGLIVFEKGKYSARIKSFAGDEEKKILEEFNRMLHNYSGKRDFTLCAHNGKEFDFPFIARRMLINRLTLPPVLDIAGKKPWEVNFADTMELWKFGDFKSYTSLELLAAIFGIPTPKDDIDGSMVGKVYHEEHDLERIVTYCEKDVLTLIQLLLKFKGMEIIPEENVEYVK